MLQATAEANNLAAQASAYHCYNREIEEVGVANNKYLKCYHICAVWYSNTFNCIVINIVIIL